jgi:multidrug efflux pump subunit AcrA (membrane-fusion protein)
VTELQGGYQVAVLDSANTIGIRKVKLGDQIGSMWIVAEGLKAGERVDRRASCLFPKDLLSFPSKPNAPY